MRLRGPERVAQTNPCQHGRAHGSTSREVCQACSLPRQDEAVFDVETVAHRPQGVAGGGKLAIQRDSDATPEDGHGWYQRPQQRARNHTGNRSRKAVICHRTHSRRLGGDGGRLVSATARLERERVPQGDHKGSCSATIPCNNHAKGTCARGDKCRFSHASSDSKPGGNGGKDKKANNKRDRCKKCGKIPNPPHRETSCPEASSSAQVVLTSPQASSSSEVAPPGLHAPVNNSANSANVMALASILRGSSASARATRLATLARSAGYVVRQFFLCSLHVIKPSICPWSCILSQMCSHENCDEVDCSIATGDRWRRFDPRHDRGPALWRHRLSRLRFQPPALRPSFQHSQR